MERVRVEVDPELKALIPGFLRRKRQDVRRIHGALKRRDFAAIARLAHKLKGEGGSFGFHAFTEMAAVLEQRAEVKDGDSAREVAARLLQYLDDVDVV